MKRSLAWLAGIVGIAALGRMLSKREGTPATDRLPPPAPSTETEIGPSADPAEELRRKLAANRQTEEPSEAEPSESLEERRARVHAKAREAIDAMSDEGATE